MAQPPILRHFLKLEKFTLTSPFIMEDQINQDSQKDRKESISSFEDDYQLKQERATTKGLIQKAQRMMNSVQQLFRELGGNMEDHGMLNHHLQQAMKLLRKTPKQRIAQKKDGLLERKRVPFDKTWILRCESEKRSELLDELYSDGRVTRHSILKSAKDGQLESVLVETHSRTTFEKLRKEASIEPIKLKDFFKADNQIDAADKLQIQVHDLSIDLIQLLSSVIRRKSMESLRDKETLERKMEVMFNHLDQKVVQERNISAFVYAICLDLAVKDKLKIVGFEYPLTSDTYLDGLLCVGKTFIIIENKFRKKSSGRKDTYNRGYAEKLLAKFPETEMVVGFYFSYTLEKKKFQLVIEIISILEEQVQRDTRMLLGN